MELVIPPWPIFNRHPVKRLPVETESYINQDRLVHEAYHKRVSAAGTNTFDAILFGVNETKPQLIKLPWSHAVNEGLPWQKLDRELWFNSREHFLRTMYVQTFGANGPPLGRTLAIIYDDNFLVNGSPINQCIQNITRGKAVHPWAGNILALRARGMPSDFYSDIVMEEDLAPLIRYFEDYGR